MSVRLCTQVSWVPEHTSKKRPEMTMPIILATAPDSPAGSDKHGLHVKPRLRTKERQGLGLFGAVGIEPTQ
jgi:hypothetical protein